MPCLLSPCLYIRDAQSTTWRRHGAAHLPHPNAALALDLVRRGDMTRHIRRRRPAPVVRATCAAYFVHGPATRRRRRGHRRILCSRAPVNRAPAALPSSPPASSGCGCRSRAIGLTGPRDLYRTAHSPVWTDYSQWRDIAVSSFDIWNGTTWYLAGEKICGQM